ncbi:MAG: hypothetical protein EON58_09825 [Alphaproteobacteria bacterium]|nr:MAG: hypothetical protein EON58_09825 [Alphaproteobacteria bacterium]
MQDVAGGKCQRLMILTPPSHGLTALLKYFLAYLRERNALNRKNAPLWYATSSTESAQRVAGQALALSDIGNQGILATAAGHPITGYAFHTAIVDSPYPNADSASYTEYREWVNDWFDNDVATRKHKPESPIVVAGSRYHWGDLMGNLIGTRSDANLSPWHVVYLPIFGGFPLPRYLQESCDKFGTTVEIDDREKGEILCPSFFTLNDLSRMRLQMGEEAWQSQWELDPL